MNQNFPGIDPTAVFDHLSQPVLALSAGEIVYANRAARRAAEHSTLTLSAILDEENLALYREYDHRETLSLLVNLGGSAYQATICHDTGFDILIADARVLHERVSMDTVALVAQTARENLTDMFDAMCLLFPDLEEYENSDFQQHCARMTRSFYQQLRLAANLGDIVGFFNGETRGVFERTEITEYFGRIFDFNESLCAVNGVKLEYQCKSDPFWAAIDRQKLERATLNLLSNALRVTPEGGKIILRLENYGSSFHLRVIDNGCGIAPDILSTLFDRYETRPQLTDSRWRLGLGLPLSQCIAQLHFGTLAVSSREGEGTTVTMSISCKIPPSPPEDVDSPLLNFDYASGLNHSMLELSDMIPVSEYDSISLV